MHVVLDPNVLIAAMLSPGGTPARIVSAWIDGAFELVVSPLLLTELERSLAYPKLRKRIGADAAAEVLEWLRRSASVSDDPEGPAPVRSRDSGDDYLLALAAAHGAVLVSGDQDLLVLGSEGFPIYSPAEFAARFE